MKEARRELEAISEQLTETQWKLVQIILEIPSSRLATYGCLALIYYRRHDHQISAQMVARTRKKLHGLLTHDTRVPLHRIASEGDLYSKKDSPETQCYNTVLRNREGTYHGHDPWWWGS